MAESDDSTVLAEYKRGLELARAGEFFEAHEAFEPRGAAARAGERDFFQGLVHVVVSAYQPAAAAPSARSGSALKALRRLAAVRAGPPRARRRAPARRARACRARSS